jgi:hypothetical protein
MRASSVSNPARRCSTSLWRRKPSARRASGIFAPTRSGCRVREIAEPGLDPAVAMTGSEGIDAYVHLPNFLIVAAERRDFAGC